MVALGVYMAGGQFDQPRMIATMTIAAALWTLLYAVNEASDLMQEHQMRVSRKTRLLLLSLCAVVCAGAVHLSPMFGDCVF